MWDLGFRNGEEIGNDHMSGGCVDDALLRELLERGGRLGDYCRRSEAIV